MLLPILLLASTYVVHARSTAGDSVLVVQDSTSISNEYSLFWKSLESRGYDLTFRTSKTAAPLLVEHDEPMFDHLILFAPNAKSLPQDLSPQNLYSFIELGKNVLVVLSSDLSELWRDFGREFEVDFDERGNLVIDHFQHDTALDDGTHTTLIIPLSQTSSPFVSSTTRDGPPLLFKGIGHEVGRLPLLSSILYAPSSSYSFEIKDNDCPTEDLFVAGSTIGLVSAMQAKNNARITFVGSMDLFSDVYALAPIVSSDGTKHGKSGNVDFIRDITSWTFQEAGVLKINQAIHSRKVDGASLEFYRVRDVLNYDVEISSYATNAWSPFSATDLQLDLTMLDPHLRLPLKMQSSSPANNSTLFSSQFEVPDKHGVFTLKLDYRRPGWSYLDESSVISITPPRHDEYPRFIGGATPYYTAAFSVSIATVLFATFWILQ